MSTLLELHDKWQAIQPLSESDRQRLDRKFMLDFNYNSNHIEGNTLTYGQTELLLLLGKVQGEAKMRDCEEMKAHNVCLQMMQEEAKGDNPLTEKFIRQLHHTLLREDYTVYQQLGNGQQTSYTIHAGRYKTRPNSVVTPLGERFEYASPEETPALMYDLVNWYNGAEKKSELSPIEKAALFHYRYIRIHPFEDGNGRIARLMVNYIFLRHKYPMVDVPSRNKRTYLNALSQADLKTGPIPSEGAHASLQQIASFVKYIEKLMITTIASDLDFINNAQQGWWYDGEIVAFRSEKTPQILSLLAEHPRITIAELSEKIKINTSAVQKQLKRLVEKGYIVKSGRPLSWQVVIRSTTMR